MNYLLLFEKATPKASFELQLMTKYLAKSKRIKQKWLRPENFDILFCVWTAITKYYIWRDEWILACVSHPIFRLPFYFQISSDLSVRQFYKLCGNSFTKFIILDIRFRFTCGKLNLNTNTINFQNHLPSIVRKFSTKVSSLLYKKEFFMK